MPRRPDWFPTSIDGVNMEQGKRTLGMIPGFKPPEGVVEMPKGFERLPTQKELHTIVKSWFANRSELTGGLGNDQS